MDAAKIITLAMAVAVGAGAFSAWYKRSEGQNTISLLRTNIEAYKTSEAQHLQRITELEALLKARDEALTQSRASLRDAVKAFKEYKK